MNSYVEILVLVGIVTVALTGAALVRRRTQPNQGGFGGLAFHVMRPVLVLALTPLVIWGLRAWPAAVEWLDANPSHATAWFVFWLGVLALCLLEAIARQVIIWRGREWPVPDLLEDLLRTALVLLLALAVLRVELGWDIRPLLASTALITAVIGFALQGVLGNLLAGMSMHLTRTVKQGDWISVGTSEGRVKRTNWRETRISTIDGHELIVPNSQVAEAVVHNINHPTPVRRHRIQVGASYSDEPDEVIEALELSAREITEVMARPAPNAIVAGFEDYGVNYELRFWSRQYHRRAWVEGQVSRHIWYKFKRRGIEIPFPMSDKLLNDFMAVVYKQRRMGPEEKDLSENVVDLAASQLSQLTDLDGDDLATLAPLVRRQRWTAGETLMRQGEDGDTFYVLVSGQLEGHIEGDPPVTFTVDPGEVVGEMSLLAGEPRGATLTTEGSCVTLTFDQEAFVALLGLRPEVPEQLADLAAQRLAENRAAADKLREKRAEVTVDRAERAGILRRFLGMLARRG